MPSDDNAPMPDGWIEAGYTEECWRIMQAVKHDLEVLRPHEPEPPGFEDQVLEGLREVAALLREIRDRLPPTADR